MTGKQYESCMEADFLTIFSRKRISMKFKIFLLVMFIGILPSISSAQNDNDEREKIKTTLVKMWEAIEKEDIDSYAKYIHPNFTQFGETDSVLLEGKEAEVSGTSAWIKNSKDIHTEMIDPKVTIKGNCAWITYYWSDNGITNGKEFASKGKSTRIFVKEKGKWLCIHGHYTLLP